MSADLHKITARQENQWISLYCLTHDDDCEFGIAATWPGIRPATFEQIRGTGDYPVTVRDLLRDGGPSWEWEIVAATGGDNDE